MSLTASRSRIVFACLLAAAVAACSGGGSSSSGGPGVPSEPTCEGTEYASTFDAIQAEIFEKHGCTQDVCHGSAKQGGLELTRGVAYQNIFDVRALGSTLKRVEPGDKTRSYLFLKLAAATAPGSVEITGAPMPNGLPPLGDDELEAVRRWIYAGAPETGTVDGTATLLNGCLPPPKPITIKPLDPPAPGDGVQFVLPTVFLAKKHEQEVCFATYYDISAQVPTEFQDPSGKYFRFAGQELRQDPQSHHLVLMHSGVPVEDLHDPAFGRWSCAGGEHADETCEPTDLGSCPGSFCRSEPDATALGCVGYGPRSTNGLPILNRQIGGAQAAQAQQTFHDGVFAQVPMKGVLYWNSHAFNLTDEDFDLNGRLNFTFAKDQRYPVRPIFEARYVFAPSAAPYTTQTVCGEHVLPQGARLFAITSHTHKRGKHFQAWTPDGSQIYENSIYNDPVKQAFEPPLAFDAADAAERTIRYCATYNNGVAEDGSPDPETVTRASRVPQSARNTIGGCKPTACAAGKIGAACAGEDDDATCDSTPGAGDGDCDACRITGGESTENEMFLLIGQYYIDEHFPQPDDDLLVGGLASEGAPRHADDGRSLFVGFAAPPALGCATSPGGDAGHAAHGS
ncbi:MAG: hypothetical protein U0842_04475 [Candidatus Binatia bacterium]